MLGGMGRGPTLVGVTFLAFFGVMGARLAISPLVPELIATFDVTEGMIGVALTLMWATYALLQYPSGILGDRFGERPVILAGLGLLVGSTALLTVIPNFAWFVVVVTLIGGSSGLYYSVATALLTKRFHNVGRAIGIHASAGPVAGVVIPIIVVWLLTRYGLRGGLAAGVLVTLPAFVIAVIAVPRTPPARPADPLLTSLEIGELRGMLGRPHIAFTTVLATLVWFGFQAAASFIPEFMVSYHGVSREVSNGLFSVYFVLVGVGMIVTGEVSERLSRDVTITVGAVIGVVGFAALTLVTSVGALAMAVGACGVSMSVITPIEARFMDDVTDEERATVFGLVRTIFQSLGALGSTVTGAVADVAGWGLSFLIISGLLFVIAVLVLGHRVLTPRG